MKTKIKICIFLIIAILTLQIMSCAFLYPAKTSTSTSVTEITSIIEITNIMNTNNPTSTETEVNNNIMADTTDINFDKNSVYYKYADEAIGNLLKNYWNDSKDIFYDKYPHKTSGGLNYWWMAHSVDVLTDAYIRTGDEKYKDYADKVIATVVKKNGGRIINDYYDDMEWMALAILRLYNEVIKSDESLKDKKDKKDNGRKYISYV